MTSGLLPTAELIDARLEALHRSWDPFHARCDKIEELFDRRHAVPLPQSVEDVEVFRAPWAEATLARAMAIGVSLGITFSRVPLGRTQRAKDFANLIERWDVAAWQQMEFDSDTPVLQNTIQNVLMFGVGWIQLYYLPHAFAEYDEYRQQNAENPPEDYEDRKEELKQKARFPFLIRDVDPRAVMASRDMYGLREVAVTHRKPRYEIIEDYDGSVGLDSRGKLYLRKTLGEGFPGGSQTVPALLEEVEFVEYHTRTYTAYYVPQDHEILEVVEHKAGRPMIFEARGLSTASRDPLLMYRSIISPALDIIPILDSYLTMAHYYAGNVAYPAFFLQTTPDPSNVLMNSQQRGQTFPLKPGQLMLLDPGDSVVGMPMPPIADVLKDQIGLLRNMLKEISPVPDILRGESPGAGTPGYAVRQLRQEARQVHQPTMLGTGNCGGQVMFTVHKLVDLEVGEPVYVVRTLPSGGVGPRAVGYLKIGPTELMGDYRVAASLRSDDDMQDITMYRAANELVQTGFIPHAWALEHLARVEDPEQMLEDIDVEQGLKNPQVQQIRIENALTKAGLAGLVQQAANKTGPVMGPGGAPMAVPDAGAPAGMGVPGTPMPPMEGLPPPGAPPGSPPPDTMPAPPLGGLQGVPILPATLTQLGPGPGAGLGPGGPGGISPV